jgi:hypothetical protein
VIGGGFFVANSCSYSPEDTTSVEVTVTVLITEGVAIFFFLHCDLTECPNRMTSKVKETVKICEL